MINTIRGLSAIALAAALAAPAVAADAGASAKKPNGEKVICREMEQLGSRLATKRVCLTRDQWRQQAEMQRQDLDKNQRSRTGRDGT